jgi:hypothetical protein
MSIRRKVKEYTQAPITHHLVMEMLSEYSRPNDKISELVKKGELLSLRRGMYVAGPEFDLPVPDLFVIANNLRGPSYVSLESAMYYWGMIPERVFEISSVTTKTSKDYNNKLGRFTYKQLPTPYYSFGLENVKLSEFQVAIIASKEKAICDKIILTSGVLLRSINQTIDFLIEDMRIDEELLLQLDTQKIVSWLEEAPKKSSLEMLIKTLNRL